MRLFAAEEARRQRQRIDELRRRNGEAAGHERKERALIDERVEAVRSHLAARRIAAHREIVGEHRLHVRRKERRIAPQAIAHRLVQKDRDLVVRLLPDEHRLRQRERAKVDFEARVDARARDDRRNAPRLDAARTVISIGRERATLVPSRASNDGNRERADAIRREHVAELGDHRAAAAPVVA